MLMIEIHTTGWKKFICDSTVRSSIKGTSEWTFEKRSTELIELLKFSKRTCEDLLKGEKLHSIVGAPHVLQTRTKSNLASNKRKADRIRVATDLEKQQAAARGEDEGPKKGKKRAREEDEGEEEQVAKSKRVKTDEEDEKKKTQEAPKKMKAVKPRAKGRKT
jgi:hypothetical protein